MSEPSILLEDTSPNGNVTAIVEQDDRVVFFYLVREIQGERDLRPCWVRNLIKAPDYLDVAHMHEGLPPLMPRAHCAHSEGAPRLDASSLRLVWSEEGDAAALYEGRDLLCIIPSWGGVGGFKGYARDCVGESSIAWELGDRQTNACVARYELASDYWKSWDEENTWPDYRDQMLDVLGTHWGEHSRYFAIDGNCWPPKALALFNCDTQSLLVTIGVSMRAQPGVELHTDEPEAYRRFELGVSCDSTTVDSDVKQIAAYVSGQTGLPWAHNTWLGHGHTLPSDVFANLSHGRMPCALLSTRHPEVPEFALPLFRNDPVNLLWMIPITEKERRFAVKHGSIPLTEALFSQRAKELGSFTRKEIILP